MKLMLGTIIKIKKSASDNTNSTGSTDLIATISVIAITSTGITGTICIVSATVVLV